MIKVNTRFKILAQVPLAFLGLFSLVQGAEVTWGQAKNVETTAEVLNAGTTVEAFNFGYQAAGLNSVTVNGVPFAAVVQPSPLSDGNGNAYSQLDGSSSGDADYDNLLNSIAYGGGESASLTVGGGELVAGQIYQLQIWFVEERSNASADARVMTYGDGNGNTVDLGNTTGAQLGQYAVGTFTADSANQTLQMTANGFSNCHLTAYQIRKFPASEIKVVDTDLIVGTGFQVTFSGLDTNANYELRRSIDLQGPWTPVAGTAKIPATSTDAFIDPSAPSSGKAFYRLWVVE